MPRLPTYSEERRRHWAVFGASQRRNSPGVKQISGVLPTEDESIAGVLTGSTGERPAVKQHGWQGWVCMYVHMSVP